MHRLFDARIENLKADRLIGVECLSCQHCTTVPALLVKAKLPRHAYVQALSRHMRCQRCGARNARLYVGWALGFEGELLSVSPADAKRTP